MSDIDIELSEKGVKEFESMVKKATELAIESFTNTLDDNCTNWVNWIESDSWSNYREQLRHALQYDYASILEKDSYWAKGVRKMILKEHKDELTPCLNQDLLEQLDNANKQIKRMEEMRRDYY